MSTPTPAGERPASIPIHDLLPGELFRLENDDRMFRCVAIHETERGYVRLTFGSLGNSQNDRSALFSASARVVPAWP